MGATDQLQVWDALEGKTFLICVGAAKCATSWLHHYLGSLPEVAVSPLKEIHFFDAKFSAHALGDMEGLATARLAYHLEQPGDTAANLRAWPSFRASLDRVQMIYDNNAYLAHFARLCTPATRAFCDLTPSYSAIGPEGFAYMKWFCSTQKFRLRILFLMRDPVDRLWSQLRHLQQMKPANDVAVKWPRALDSAAIQARADYRGIVSTLDTTFPAEDIQYLFYETLFAEASLRRLCEFIGVPYRPGDATEIRNRTSVTLPLPEDARAAFHAQLAPQYAFCRDRFGGEVPTEWRH
ncbi:sulfotransferase [Cribrihabitans sp. XS_ASV171]